MNVGIATRTFSGSFLRAFPTAEVIGTPNDYERGKYDLLIFTGGEDVHPSRYGNSVTYSRGMNPERDEAEFGILNKALQEISEGRNIKILGVCRGLQLINVGLGGTLSQDIETDGFRPHTGTHALEHYVKNIFGDMLKVNSMHHQGILEIGKYFTLSSGKTMVLKPKVIAEYGNLIEMIMWSNAILATQFHPEFFDDDLYDSFFEKVIKWVGGKDIIEVQKDSLAELLKVKGSIFSIDGTGRTTTGSAEFVIEDVLELLDEGEEDDEDSEDRDDEDSDEGDEEETEEETNG